MTLASKPCSDYREQPFALLSAPTVGGMSRVAFYEVIKEREPYDIRGAVREACSRIGKPLPPDPSSPS